MIHSLLKAYILQKLASSVPDLLSRQLTLQLHGKLNIFQGSERSNEIEGLENKTELVKTDGGKQSIGCRKFDSEATNVDVTLRWLINSSNDIEQGGLTTARGTEDRDELTLLHREIDTSKSRYTFNTKQVGLVHIHNLDDLARSLINLLIAFFLIGIILVHLLSCSLLAGGVIIRADHSFENLISIVLNQSLIHFGFLLF